MKAHYFGAGIPTLRNVDLQGRLIVLEGPDCVGRSTQIRLLQEWLENLGYGVVTTSLCRSELTEIGLTKAKRGHEIGRRTLALFYATDLADRLERAIVPALQGGFIVLADRYIYTIFARYGVRGLSAQWLRKAYSFALVPHLTLYLEVDLDVLAERALKAEKLGFWECGMDMNLADNLYDSFMRYQKRMIRAFAKMTKEFEMTKVSAHGSVMTVQQRLRRRVRTLLDLKETEAVISAPEGPVVEGMD
ncbi:MAG TPA: thymidylate kinase [Candidatus Hydrogenedentes bacterium]|nr:thymidylate kinase [Candidatus Hydrogenedentota bacterium]HOS01811.1 thymidylate kinase [Candidatus Hydrogenedentota bacterium]